MLDRPSHAIDHASLRNNSNIITIHYLSTSLTVTSMPSSSLSKTMGEFQRDHRLKTILSWTTSSLLSALVCDGMAGAVKHREAFAPGDFSYYVRGCLVRARADRFSCWSGRRTPNVETPCPHLMARFLPHAPPSAHPLPSFKSLMPSTGLGDQVMGH